MAQDRPSSAVNSCIYLPVELNKRLMEEASVVSVAVSLHSPFTEGAAQFFWRNGKRNWNRGLLFVLFAGFACVHCVQSYEYVYFALTCEERLWFDTE
eukprot:scaffold113437_cov50-Cyclotella_meneghiniana.AAC.4